MQPVPDWHVGDRNGLAMDWDGGRHGSADPTTKERFLAKRAKLPFQQQGVKILVVLRCEEKVSLPRSLRLACVA